MFDVRVEKTVEIGGSARVRGFLDLFKIMNSHTPERITTSTGPNYLVPLAVLAPFTARVGFRLEW